MNRLISFPKQSLPARPSVHEQTVNRSIKVVIMSALYKSTRYRIEAMKAFHADEYLAKPIDFARLQQVLGKLAVKAAA